MQTQGTSEQISLDQLKTAIKQYMHIENGNDFIIDLILAVAISLELEQPVWLMLIAPPSSGKTELLNIIDKLKDFHFISNLTEHSLISGHTDAKGGYMIREVHNKGILAFSDLTTVLRMPARKRDIIMSHLRVIYDGKAGLQTGIDTEKVKMWEGKVAVLACVTDVIETEREKTGDVGERFLHYWFDPPKRPKDFNGDIPDRTKKRMDVKKYCKRFVEQKRKIVASVVLDDCDRGFVNSLADFISIARTSIPRAGYSREITNVPRPEQPHRLIISLSSLYKALICINNGDKERARTILREVAKSSIPHLRRLILERINKIQQEVTVKDIIYFLELPETTVRRVIEDLKSLKILNYTSITINFVPSKIELRAEFRTIMNDGFFANASVPENAVGVK